MKCSYNENFNKSYLGNFDVDIFEGFPFHNEVHKIEHETIKEHKSKDQISFQNQSLWRVLKKCYLGNYVVDILSRNEED